MGSAFLRVGKPWFLLVAFHLAWLGGAAGSENASAKGVIEKVREELKTRLARQEGAGPSFCRKEALCGQAVLTRFYQNRGFQPAWMDPEDGFVQARDLIESIRRSPVEGLTPDVYHLAVIQALLAGTEKELAAGRPQEVSVLADLEILLTDAFLLYSSHLLSGRVDPETIHSKWAVKSREADLAGLLQASLEESGITEALQGLLPTYPAYLRLRKGLEEYRAIRDRGGWDAVSKGPSLHEGERDPRIASLRARLIASGDLEENGAEDPEAFDEGLAGAVRTFQSRQGLTVDGVVGAATLAALNVPVEERIRQIEVNLERWRWLPDDLGARYVLVNTAGFFLQVVEEGREVLAMRVVVGRKARRTPVFSGRMIYLVLNPSWHVPHKLAVRDILPKIKEDPAYLGRQGIRVFESWEEAAPEIPPETIDWSGITKFNFAYRLVQDPGPTNALGRVKFMFPNKFAVYLHDTPQRYMFERNQRDFSSGCIRIEAPVDLAAYVLRGDPRWTREAILAAIENGKTRTVWLPEPIPVHVLYWTAWVDGEGKLCFRRDVYDRDGPLARALEEGPLRYQ